MKKLLTIFRRSLHTIAFAVVLVIVALYVAVHFNLAGMVVEQSLTEELAEKLETRVTLEGDVEVDWFNQVVLNHLTVYDQQDDTLLYARRVLIAYDLWPLLHHHLVLNTCQLIDFDIRAKKDSMEGKHNFQFIVEALQKKDPDSQSFIEELDLNAILLRMGRLSYDVEDQPHSNSFPLDKNHIQIEQFSANLHLHDKLLQAKKVHFLANQTAVKANRIEMVLDPMLAIREDQFVFSLSGFEADGNQLRLSADMEGEGRRINLHLHDLATSGALLPLPQLHDLSTEAEIVVNDILAPLDSLELKADILRASAVIDPLGMASMKATIEGMPCHSQLNIQLSTDKGNAELQGTLACNFQQHDYQLAGHCLTPGFDLSALLPASAEIGQVALDADFDLRQTADQPVWISMDGNVGRLDFRQHTYHDIRLTGESQGKQAQGSIVLADSLGSIDLTYDFDMRHPQARYKLDGTIKELQPTALNLMKQELLDSLSISAKINADIIAQEWNKAEGIVNLTQLSLHRGEEQLRLEPIQFEGTTDRGTLSSQMLHLDYQRDRHDHSYRLEGHLPVDNELYALLRLPVRATSVTRFYAVFDQKNQLREGWLDLPTVIVNQDQQIAAMAEVKSGPSGELWPSIDLSLQNAEHSMNGTLKGELILDPLEITLFPTTFIYNKEELYLTGAHMIRNEEGAYSFQNFSLQGAGQSLSASGIVGGNGSNDLIVQLDHFELGQIFSIFNKGYVDFEGQATGDIVLTSDPQTRLKTEELLIENFTYIDTLLGDAHLNLDFNLPKKLIEVSCDIVADKEYVTHASGDIRLGDHDSLDLWFDTNRLPLGFINYWSGNILQQFSGRITGPVRLYGDAKALQLNGDPVVDGSFTHNVIGAHFHLNDKVHLEENLLQLQDVTVDDCHGHTLQLNANVTHDHLSNFGYEVDLQMPAASQGFLVMDREQAPGRIYWGQLYISGEANLKGGNGHHRFNLNVATTDKSWFYLSPFERDFTSENDGDGYAFLTFRDKASLLDDLSTTDLLLSATKEASIEQEPQDDKTDIQVDMQVNATDQCQVTVQLDPLADDKLICRGRGDLAVHYDPRRDITLAGTYHISSGTYGMSMKGDLMSKIFQLQNTSSVRFSGVPSEAELALDARYGIPSVNLTDLDESITTLGSLSRSSVPVDCVLSVTGQLSSPQVSFDLEVKNVSEEIQAYVHNVIGTQEMLNQEVLYLLLFSKFYTPQYAQSTQSRSGSELSSFASASITSQLNQLLGHLSDSFTMGTNFRTDRGDFSDMEMDLSLSTRLMGDRLLLNGNLGYRDPAHRLGRAGDSNSFIGDFDLEFLINNSGTVRAKAYSHYNERDYSINNALTTQGIGFILRKDFKSFYDLWRRKK